MGGATLLRGCASGLRKFGEMKQLEQMGVLGLGLVTEGLDGPAGRRGLGGRVSGNEPGMGANLGGAGTWGSCDGGASKVGDACRKEPNRFKVSRERGGSPAQEHYQGEQGKGGV